MITKEIWVMIKYLSNQGLNKSEISRYLNIDRKTVSSSLQKDHGPQYFRRVKVAGKLDGFKEYIDNRLSEYNLTAQRLYQEVLSQGYTGKYSLLASYVKDIKLSYKKQAVLRFETLPGEQAQVDWAYMGTFYDHDLKRTVKLYCFLIILGYSRKLYIEFFTRADLKHFLLGHNHAFEYFGGYSREILYDNLKSVVLKRRLKASDSDFNKKFMDFAGYYGFKPVLCRPYKPNTKGKVENSVSFVRKNFFNGRQFQSVEHLNQESLLWLEQINNRRHGTTYEIVNERFKREQLIPLKETMHYDLTDYFYRQVYTDCHFSYQANKYSVPYQYAAKEVCINEITNDEIAIFYRNKQIACHKLETTYKGQYITNPAHLHGLKELRSSHQLNRPKKPSKNADAQVFKLINGYVDITETTVRSLSCYEEVI